MPYMLDDWVLVELEDAQVQGADKAPDAAKRMSNPEPDDDILLTDY